MYGLIEEVVVFLDRSKVLFLEFGEIFIDSVVILLSFIFNGILDGK